jgi:SAM-dependent methyltransferase
MTPEPWLTDHHTLLPHHGRALDVACGTGRHACWLAARGLEVLAVDRDEQAIAAINQEARARAWPLVARVRDLEAGKAALGRSAFDVIVCVHYLHRPLFPALLEALRPGGLLIYETFTRNQARRGKPTNPAFLLEPGELPRLVGALEIVDQREGDYGSRSIASIVARRRLAPAL